MKYLATVAALSAAVLIGCGGMPGTTSSSTSTSTSSTGQSPSGSEMLNVAGNWQFITVSTVPGKPPLTLSGSISSAGTAVSGAVHVDGSTCFDRLTTMGLTGIVTASGTTLTSTVFGGQSVTFAGSFTVSPYAEPIFTGTYSINGGCAAGDQGSVTGSKIDILDADSWAGTFTSSAQKTFNVKGDFAQNASAGSEGSFGITGNATFDTPCFDTSVISPGSFPSDSYVMGTIVSLEIKTSNGTLAFQGTVAKPVNGLVSGTYSISGGTCDQTGTAVVTLGGQWDYH
jgi:hypothetical protein